jgi:Trp operon repressor
LPRHNQKHLSSDMKHPQNQQVQWRGDKVQELCSKGYSQREILQVLQIGLATVNNGIEKKHQTIIERSCRQWIYSKIHI